MPDRVQLLQLLQDVRSESEMAGLLHRVAARFAMSSFTIYDLPSPDDMQLQPSVQLTNARRFHDDYDRHQLLSTSPLFAQLRKSTAPGAWDLDEMREGRSEAQYCRLREIAADAGIRCTVMIPVHKIDGTRGAVSFAGDRDKVSAHELGILGLIAVHVYDIFDRLRNRSDSLPPRLTSREIEVLEWAANGKTSGEIASILSLSDHTINTYMNSAMRKLDCVNRTQLVAKALRLRLIR
jgi:DNA-binding CsgD family transcriptional regulator